MPSMLIHVRVQNTSQCALKVAESLREDPRNSQTPHLMRRLVVFWSTEPSIEEAIKKCTSPVLLIRVYLHFISEHLTRF